MRENRLVLASTNEHGQTKKTAKTIYGQTVEGASIMLEVGSKAPDFSLQDQQGNWRRLSDFRGKKVILYFYPKDNTAGCTKQACAYARTYEEFQELNSVVIGISKDSVASHEKFAAKYELPFLLLSDPDKSVLEAYGVWQEKKLYGKVSMGVVRSSVVIDEEGNIEKVMMKVKADSNADDVLTYLKPEVEA